MGWCVSPFKRGGEGKKGFGHSINKARVCVFGQGGEKKGGPVLTRYNENGLGNSQFCVF